MKNLCENSVAIDDFYEFSCVYLFLSNMCNKQLITRLHSIKYSLNISRYIYKHVPNILNRFLRVFSFREKKVLEYQGLRH